MKRLVIVVKSGSKSSATTHVKTEDSKGGDKTFSGEGLSPTGEAPATHLWCSWWLDDSGHDRLTEKFKGLVSSGSAEVYDASAWDQLEADRLLDKLGLLRIGKTVGS